MLWLKVGMTVSFALGVALSAMHLTLWGGIDRLSEVDDPRRALLSLALTFFGALVCLTVGAGFAVALMRATRRRFREEGRANVEQVIRETLEDHAQRR